MIIFIFIVLMFNNGIFACDLSTPSHKMIRAHDLGISLDRGPWCPAGGRCWRLEDPEHYWTGIRGSVAAFEADDVVAGRERLGGRSPADDPVGPGDDRIDVESVGVLRTAHAHQVVRHAGDGASSVGGHSFAAAVVDGTAVGEPGGADDVAPRGLVPIGGAGAVVVGCGGGRRGCYEGEGGDQHRQSDEAEPCLAEVHGISLFVGGVAEMPFAIITD